MKYKKHIKSLIISIIAIISFIGLINFLKGNSFFHKGRCFYAIYKNIFGLEVSRPVLLNGLKIGKVESIDFLPDKSGRLIVSFRIWSNFKFSKKSKAVISESGFMINPQINLILSKKGKIAVDQDTLSSSIKFSQINSLTKGIDPIKIKFQKTLDNINNILNSVNFLLKKEDNSGIKKTIIKFNNMLDSIKSGSDAVSLMINSNQSNLNYTIKSIKDLINSYEKFAIHIKKVPIKNTFSNINNSLKEFNQFINNINKKNGTLGMLAGDNDLYNNFNNISKELELLIHDFRLNPKRYINFSIFGKK